MIDQKLITLFTVMLEDIFKNTSDYRRDFRYLPELLGKNLKTEENANVVHNF